MANEKLTEKSRKFRTSKNRSVAGAVLIVVKSF